MNRILYGAVTLLIVLWSMVGNAQTVKDYSFSASSGTFTPLTGGTNISSIEDDDALSSPIPIGFSFTYEGTAYTKLKVSSNGFLQLDTTSTASRSSNSISGVNEPIIAPVWDDLAGEATGNVSSANYLTTGSSPNRVFTVELLDWEWNYNSSSPKISFQVKLYEGSNKIEFIYRPGASSPTSPSAHIGLCGAGTGSGSYLSVNGVTTSATASSTSATNITAAPDTGVTFSFTPPSCNAPSGIMFSGITATSANLAWTSTNHVGDSFLLQYGLPGFTTPIGTIVDTVKASGSFASIIGLTSGTNYEVKVLHICSATDSSGFTTSSFTTTYSAPYTEDFESFSAGGSLTNGWSSIRTADPQWEVESGTTSSSNTGPNVDNTTGTSSGKYMNFDASGATSTNGYQDTLTSPFVITGSLTNPYLQFFYHMYGSTMGKLYVEVKDTMGTWARVDSIVGQQHTSSAQAWTQRKIDLISYAGQNGIQIRFLGEKANNYYGDIGVDDIQIIEKPSIDLSAESVYTTNDCLTSSEPVYVVIKNNLTKTLIFSTNNANVGVNISGAGTGNLATTVNTDSLTSGDTMHVLVGSFNMSTSGNYNLKGYGIVVGDGNTINDSSAVVTLSQDSTYSIPQKANFAGFTGSNLSSIHSGWREGSGANEPLGTSSVWNNSDATQTSHFGQTTAKVNLYTTTRNEWIVSPKMTASATDTLVFKAALTDYNDTTSNTMGSDDSVNVYVSNNCGKSWTRVYSITSTNQPGTSLVEHKVALGSYAGDDIIVGIKAQDGPVDDTEDYDFHITDIFIGVPPQNDAGVTQMLASTFCPGPSDVKVVIENFGAATLTSATVNWTVSVNGALPVAQTPFSWTGSKNTKDTAHVNLGSYTFNANDTYDIVVYTSSPNGSLDDDNTNDTLKTMNLQTAMSGTYTLGGLTPNFSSFGALDTALKNKGLCGAVRVLVRQGTYNEQIKFDNVKGLSSVNTLEIVADQANTSPAILSYAASTSASNYVIGFKDVDYITIDSLEVTAAGTSYGRVITYEGTNSNISITNNTLNGVSTTTSTSTNLAVIFDNTTNSNISNDLTFENNTINNGTYGAYIYGIGTTSFQNGLSFKNNRVENFRYYGLYFYYHANAVVSGNYIKDNDSYTSPYGIRLNYMDTIEVYNNEIYVGGTSAPYGIYLYYCDGNASKPVKVYNNAIGMYNTGATSTVKGIYAYQGSENRIFYNSVSIQGGSTGSYGLYINYGSGDNAEIKNNTFSNYGGGYAIYRSSSTGLSVSDYNNLYSSGTNVGYWSGARADLAAYQSASSQETNSVSADPFHKSATDLTTKSQTLDGAAQVISGYTMDIDGNTRNASTPDIGAYEFTPPANDVGVTAIVTPVNGSCGAPSHNVSVRIRNFGTAAQSSIPVTASISGGLTSSLNTTFSGPLASGADTVISVGSINSVSGATVNIAAYTTHTGDLDASNDTTEITGVTIQGLPSAPTVDSITVCAGTDSMLIANGSTQNFRWFNSMNPDSAIHVGDTLSVTNAQSSATYFIEGFNQVQESVGSTTAPTSSFITGNAGWGLGFTVNNEVIIDSLTIYPTGTGWIIIEVNNYNGTTFNAKSDTVHITGASLTATRIPVNIKVPAGTYKMNMSYNGITNLGRNSSGNSFPYNSSSGAVSITGGSTGTGAPTSGAYYWFFDWKLSIPSCPSVRDTAAITVTPLPVFDLGKDTAFCGASSVSHTMDATTSGATYKWQDNSTNATYTATAAGTYWCEVTVNGCSDVDTVIVGANPIPTVTFPNPAAVCSNDTLITLTGGAPTGGTYTGKNVSNNEFDPVAAGAGQDTLYYTYTDTVGCSAQDTAYIMVNAAPTVAFAPLSDVCLDASAVTLAGGTPTGGTYAGPGVNSGMFYADTAGVGSHKILYRYTDANNCSDTASQTQVVDSLPVVSLMMDSSWCLNAAPLQLNGGMPNSMGVSGVYTVNGVADTVYKATKSGMDTVIYTYTDSNMCVGRDTAMVMADTVPVVTFTSLSDVCVGSSMVTLNQGMPMGGTYSGNNVTGSMYDPNTAGMDTLTYVFVDSNMCSDTATQTITVNTLPTVALASQNDVCENIAAFGLTGGTPTGGTYSGTSVSGNNFDPAAAGIGSHTITYVYSDGNSCTDSATAPIKVNAVTAAVLNYIGYSCENSDSLNLTSFASPAGGTFTGTGVGGNYFESTVAGVGTHSITYSYTNTDNCTDTASRDIIVEAAPVFNITGDTVGCGTAEKAPILHSSLKGMTYHWSTGSRDDSTMVTTNGKVWLKVTDPNTEKLCSNSDTITVNYEAECVGLDEALANTTVKYFPNPNNGTFNYQLEGFEGLNIDLSIVSVNGQVIYRTSIENTASFQTGVIELNNVETGMYFVTLRTNKGSVMHRINITH